MVGKVNIGYDIFSNGAMLEAVTCQFRVRCTAEALLHCAKVQLVAVCSTV